VNQDNFDWSLTNREVVIAIPNFGRRHLMFPTIVGMQTSIPRSDWLILIVNDRVHEDFSDWEDRNVAYFTMERPSSKERNGCFIRNYYIKRMQSRILIQKDPEVFPWGVDLVKTCMGLNGSFYRAGFGVNLKPGRTRAILRAPKRELAKINFGIKPKKAVKQGNNKFFHYVYGAETRVLQDIHGYDEDYVEFGWEDLDMYKRLKRMAMKEIIDKKCLAIHLWHKRYATEQPSLNRMERIFRSKSASDFVRNPVSWGEG